MTAAVDAVAPIGVDTATVLARRPSPLRKVIMFPVAFVVFIGAWEGYKAVGPVRGGSVLGVRVLPRSGPREMPHVLDMVERLSRPEVRGSSRSVLDAVMSASWYSLRLALVGFAVGAVFGLLLAVVMSRFVTVRRGLLPYLVVSQTIPLIALAPLTVSWGGQLRIGSFQWERWMSAASLGAFLAFFPVAVGALRGLGSPRPESIELMESYAASWWQGLWKLRLPAAVPFVVPALRLAGSAAVVGVIVSEISIGIPAGIGRLVLSYSQEASGDPPKVYGAVFGAIVVGLAMAGLVLAIEQLLTRRMRPTLRGVAP